MRTRPGIVSTVPLVIVGPIEGVQDRVIVARLPGVRIEGIRFFPGSGVPGQQR